MREVIAVTGGTGFVGQALVKALIKTGSRLRILTRHGNIEKGFPSGQVEIWEGDLGDPATLSGFVDGADMVYHLAGEVRDPRRFWSVNAGGTGSLAIASRSAGVQRFLYLSSVGVVGASGKTGMVDETTTARPLNAYEVSKYAGELAVLRSHDDRGMQVSVLRPSIVFGEGHNPKTDRFLSWVRKVQAGYYVSLGEEYLNSYIYLGDLIAACLFVAGHPETGNQVYIVNQPVPLTHFVNEMAALLGVKPTGALPKPIGGLAAGLLRLSGRFGSLYNRTCFSMEKLTRLGFKPPYGYTEGLARTITWYRQEGSLPGKP